MLSLLPLSLVALGSGPFDVLEPTPTAHLAPEIKTSYDEGLTFDWQTGKLVIEGLFEVGAYGNEGASRGVDSGTYVKRMRPEFAGEFDGGWQFRFEPKFDDAGVELEEAWVGREILDGNALLRLGRMKAPFGLEEIRSRRNIHFPRFSILNQFSPAEDHGVFVTGLEGQFEYGYALYNGTGGAEEDSGKDVALHGMWHSPAGGESSWQAGCALTYGRQDRSVEGDVIKNSGGQSVLEFGPAATLDGDRLRLGFEAAWFHGPLMVQAEFLRVEQEMGGGATVEDTAMTGFYIDIARSLTGNDLDFHGPANPTDTWVAAVRLSTLRLSDELNTPGILTPGTFTEGIDSVSLGLNWIPNSHVIVRHAWTHSWYTDTVTIAGEAVDDEGLLTVELQLHF